MSNSLRGMGLSLFKRGIRADEMRFPGLLGRSVSSLVGMTGFAFCLTAIYLCMRGVMRLGGFVASGGPYEIAHPAPDWIWLFPASFLGGVVFMGIYVLGARHIGGVRILMLMWPALFLSLGWNFWEFGLHPPGQQSGVAWSWIICGVLFVLMGLPVLLVILAGFFKALRGRRESSPESPFPDINASYDRPAGNYLSSGMVAFFATVVNLTGAVGGIYLGIRVFYLLTT